MALIPCPECEWNISDKAKTCPQCGYPLAEEKLSKAVASKPSPPPQATTQDAGEKRPLKPEDFLGKAFLIETADGHTQITLIHDGSIHMRASQAHQWEHCGTYTASWPTAMLFINASVLKGKYRVVHEPGVRHLLNEKGETARTLYEV